MNVLHRIYIVCAIGVLTNSGCNQIKKSETDDENALQNISSGEKAFNRNFFDLLYSYSREFEHNFSDIGWLYYNVYFFKEETKTYFTIWMSTAYMGRYFLDNTPKSGCIECLYEIKGRRIGLFFDPKYDYSILFSANNECMARAKLENEKEYGGPIYDGDSFKRTYEVIEKESGLEFELINNNEMHFGSQSKADSVEND